MKPKHPKKKSRFLPEKGFTLVITIILVVMMTLLVVGLLTLSSVTMRGATAGQSRQEARANAQMALLLALGELQKTMGPDQAVSARASSMGVEQNGRNFTGAWKSWHWQPLSNGPNYSEKAKNFGGWLVSSPNPQDAMDFSYAARSPESPVWLINPKTIGTPSGSDDPGLQVSKVDVLTADNRRGAYAWGIMDESLKAPFQLAEPKNPTMGELMAQRQAPPRAYAEVVSKSLAPDILGDPQKILSLDTAVVAAGRDQGKEILSYQQDITPYSQGLLTDTALGGLKRDLTTLLESSGDLSNITGSNYVYPQVAGDGVPTWDYLRSHYQLYNRVSGANTSQPKITLTTSDMPPKTGTLAGLDRNPVKERLLPVVLRFQIMFSAVSHDLYLQDRKDFYNANGGGYINYATPHLVYDPVITLYNPYDVTLTLQKARIRVWDPPVLFGFQKNSVWVRNEFSQANGDGFEGLARFQIANQSNTQARRYFTFILGGGNSEQYTGAITLQPGEVRAFSPRIQKAWSWGTEIAGGTNPQVFFDWNADKKFGNQDGRTGNQLGVESVAGWDVRAGLQTDHLSYDNKGTRPAATFYPFENANNTGGGGWLAIRKTDRFSCFARAGKTVKPQAGSADPSDHDFRVDLLAGNATDTTRDIVRSYRFHFQDPVKELSENPTNPIISRNFRVQDILQRENEPSGGPGLKLPFALLTMAAKTTADVGDNWKPWLNNQPIVEGVNQDSNVVSNDLDSYDIKLKQVGDFNDIPNGIQCDKVTGKTYWGGSVGSENGVSNVPMFHVPVTPAASLGDLIPANLISSTLLPRVTYALGNSQAQPQIPLSGVTTKIKDSSINGNASIYDHSYLMNDALWDSYFFSTVAKFQNGLAGNKDRKALLEDFFKGDHPLLNTRFTPVSTDAAGLDQRISDLDGMSTEEFSRSIASAMAIKGPFNVNSDSAGAWKAVLASLRDRAVQGWGGKSLDTKDRTALARMGMPLVGEMDSQPDTPDTTITIVGKSSWAGFRALSDDDISLLAQSIVKEVRARGKADTAPSATLGEFVNRRLGGNLQDLKGLLETAIENSGINNRFLQNGDYSRQLKAPAVPLMGLQAADTRTGYTAEGSPAAVTQGDLLMALAPIITVRGDTFRIRTYGESRDANDKVIASAWCEAIVQRIPDYIDSKNKADVTGNNLENVNKVFGRRFEIVSFRWLSPEEV